MIVVIWKKILTNQHIDDKLDGDISALVKMPVGERLSNSDIVCVVHSGVGTNFYTWGLKPTQSCQRQEGFAPQTLGPLCTSGPSRNRYGNTKASKCRLLSLSLLQF